MFFVIFTLIQTAFKEKLTETDAILVLPRYSFIKKGTIDVIAKSSESLLNITVALFNEEQIRTVNTLKKERTNICQAENITAFDYFNITIENGQATFSEEIEIKDVYTLAISSCDTKNTIEFSIEFKNPHTLLSNDIYPCIYTKPVFFVLYAVALVLWFVAYHYRRIKVSPLWIVMTVTLSLLLLDYMLYTLQVHIQNRTDNKLTGLVWTRYFSRAISFALFWFVIILSGFDVALDGHLTLNTIITSGVTGLFLSIPLTFIELYNFADLELWSNVYSSVWLVVCWGISHLAVQSVTKPYIKKMAEIHKSGVDPFTTVCGEHFRSLNYHLIIYAMILFTSLVYILMPYPLSVAFWLSQLVLDLSTFAELITSLFLFCFKRQNTGTWKLAEMEEQENQELNSNEDSPQIHAGINFVDPATNESPEPPVQFKANVDSGATVLKISKPTDDLQEQLNPDGSLP